jgi:hypothetical protein
MVTYRFKEWRDQLGNVYTQNPLTINVTGDITLTAYYEQVTGPQYNLIISTTTGGTTNPAPGTYSYAEGSSVNVTALPSTGYEFDHWTLDGVQRTENPITVLMNANHTLIAYFRQIPPKEYTLTISVGTGGSTNPSPGTYSYVEGTTIQVRAYPATGYNFGYWLLDGVQYTSNPISVLMNMNHTLIAYFSEIPPPPPTRYKLNLNSTVGGTTDPAPSVYEYDAGVMAVVTAIPEEGYVFARWELDGVIKSANPLSVLMDKDHTLLAVFQSAPPPSKCFIATAAYGTPMAPQLTILRRFRDRCLPNPITMLYYRISPPIAEYIRRRALTRRVIRDFLEPIVKLLKKVI